MKQITVRTNGNGYTLSYEGMKDKNGYFYFDAETLVGGMMKHVVLGDDKVQDPEMCRALLQSMSTWTKVGELHTANARLIKEAKEAEKEAHGLRLQIYHERKRRDELIDEIQTLRTKLALATIKVNNYERLKAEVEKNERKIEKYNQL